MSSVNIFVKTLFLNIVSLSIEASIVAIAVLVIIKLLKRRISPRLSYLLWVFVLIRLVIPVLPETPVSLFNTFSVSISDIIKVGQTSFFTGYSEALNKLATTKEIETDKYQPSGSPVTNQDNYFNTKQVTDKNNSIPDTSSPGRLLILCAYLWLTISIIIIGYIIVKNLSYYRKLGFFEKADIPDNIISDLKNKLNLKKKTLFLESNEITNPCVFGVGRYVILLPEGIAQRIDETALSAILLHELAHIKRNDLAVNLLSSLICALHWFNPILWYSSFVLKSCQEVCADSCAMLYMDEEQIGSYGTTILHAARKQSRTPGAVIISAGINQNSSTLKDRIKNIANFSRKKYAIGFVGIILFVVLGVFLCTSAVFIPRTPEEKMNFQNNILLSVSSVQAKNNLQHVNLQVHNNNRTKLYNSTLVIYSGTPDTTKSNVVYKKENFNISGDNKVSLDINNLDYDNAYFEFSYNAGFTLFGGSTGAISGQLKAFDKTTDINNWGAVSDNEIAEFIEKEKIKTIGITKIYGFYTVVMFESGDLTGYYELWKDTKKNKVLSRKVQAFGEKKSAIILAGGTASGNYPFTNIVLNDDRVFVLGNRIEVQGSGKSLIIPITDKKGYTLETRGLGYINEITVFDKDEKMLCVYSIPEYDAKLSLQDVSFSPDDQYYNKVLNENNYKILGQKPAMLKVEFNSKMFPKSLEIAYKAADYTDYKLPLLKYKNSTLYLKGVYEANEGPEYLYAEMYFIHDIKDNPSGNILSTSFVQSSKERLFSSRGTVNKDTYSPELGTVKNMVSLRSTGPGNLICIYIKKDLLQKTKGNFTVDLEDLNEIRYEKE